MCVFMEKQQREAPGLQEKKIEKVALIWSVKILKLYFEPL